MTSLPTAITCIIVTLRLSSCSCLWLCLFWYSSRAFMTQTTECPHPVLCHWSDPRYELRISRPRCLIMCRIFLLCYLTLCIIDNLNQPFNWIFPFSGGLFKCTVWICVTSVVIGFPQTSADNSTNHKSYNIEESTGCIFSCLNHVNRLNHFRCPRGKDCQLI